ncbi:putative ABC multidrug transporter [Thozetella sp. PMI_491]|nr:putative ABC multidrug transporter [Thozetella sp. PMI_491]
MPELGSPASLATSADDVFGPVVDARTRSFDFTLLFEETVLGIVPTGLFLILSAFRLLALARQRKTSTVHHGFALGKTAVMLLLVGANAAILGLWAIQSTSKTRASIPTAAIALFASMMFIALSFKTHTSSHGPSVLLGSYLFLSTLFDAVRIRTLWLMGFSTPLTALFTASLGLKVLVLTLEEMSGSGEEGQCSSEERAGVISRTVFWWVNGLMKLGYSQPLSVEKLPTIDSSMSSECLWERVGKKWERGPKEGKHVLLTTVFSGLRGAALAPVIPYLLGVALAIAQPLLIQTVMDYLNSTSSGSELDRNIGYSLIAAYGLVYLCVAVVTAWSQHAAYRFVTMLRGSLVTLIYRKTVELDIVGLDDASAVTLMSTDVERIVKGMTHLHELWTTLIQIIIALFLLEREVGVAFVAPLGLFLVFGFIVGFLGGNAGRFQAEWMKATEKRVGVTSSILGSMRGVKMSGYLRKALGVIERLRLFELAAAARFRAMLVATIVMSYAPDTLSPVLVFGAYTVISQRDGTILTSTRIFKTLSLLSLITQPLAFVFGASPSIFAAVACFGRIQQFLLSKPREDARLLDRQDTSSLTKAGSVSVDWAPVQVSELTENKMVSAIAVEPKGSAVKIVNGQFGWAADGELTLHDITLSIPASGLTMIVGPVGCGKSTLLKAILGETPLHRGKVQLSTEDIAFCDQTPWLSNETLRRNVTAFAHFDPYWYARVINAAALNEDIALFPELDQCMLGSKGVSLSGGQQQRVAIARAIYSKPEIALFDDVFSGLDASTQKQVFDGLFGQFGLLRAQGTTSVLATHADHLLPFADYIVVLDSSGSVVDQGTFDALNSPQGPLHRFNVSSARASEPDRSGSKEGTTNFKPLAALDDPAEKTVDDNTRRLGDRAVYKYYFQSTGIRNVIIFFTLQATWMVLLKFPEIWLAWWGNSNQQNPNRETAKYLGVYAGFQGGSLIALALLCGHLILVMAVQSGTTLHSVLVQTVSRAPWWFFTTTDMGSIVNRFSQDIQLIDAELPLSLLNVVGNTFVAFAQIIMLLPTSYWLAATYPVLAGVLWAIQRFYLRTARQLRYLDLEAKSPVYSQFLETLGGLATIRAFAWQDELITQMDKRLNYSQKPFYLLYCIQRWLNLVLDLVAAGLAITLISVAVGLRGSVSAGFAGIALYNIMTLSAVMKSAVSMWTVLETSIGAVSRVRTFYDGTPSEERPGETSPPPEHWPSRGSIHIRGMTTSYQDNSPPALSSITLRIPAGQKVGVCGRSGSGKSSLALSLLRMLEIQDGRVTIDGVDIRTLPRDTVREHITAVPQEPYFLKGTVRLNADPRECHSDWEIGEALNQVQLWNLIDSKGGLDMEVTQDSFSHGQRQLFALARALLNPSKIVILDEASSSVDTATDKIMHQLIRERFRDSTIISVAHRLDTILDFDRVIVLGKGRIVEDDSPAALLGRQSEFRRLYDLQRGD